MATINMMMKHITKHAQVIKEIRKQALEADVEKLKKEVKKEGRITTDVKPTVGDVVVVKSDDKYIDIVRSDCEDKHQRQNNLC